LAARLEEKSKRSCERGEWTKGVQLWQHAWRRRASAVVRERRMEKGVALWQNTGRIRGSAICEEGGHRDAPAAARLYEKRKYGCEGKDAALAACLHKKGKNIEAKDAALGGVLGEKGTLVRRGEKTFVGKEGA